MPRPLAAGARQSADGAGGGVNAANAGIAAVCHSQPAVWHLAQACGGAQQGLLARAVAESGLALAASQHSPVACRMGGSRARSSALLCSALQAGTSRACAAKQAEWLAAHLHPHPFAGRHVQLSRQQRLQMGSHHRLGILSVHSAAAAPPGCGLATPRFGHGRMHALRGRPGRHQQGSGRTESWLHCIINSEVMEPASVAILCLCRGFHTTSAAAPSVQLVPAARAALPPPPPLPRRELTILNLGRRTEFLRLNWQHRRAPWRPGERLRGHSGCRPAQPARGHRA